jgi:NAD(P)-dependent dehydrogenase (short-subunit alcohol dehydrogenase family)
MDKNQERPIKQPPQHQDTQPGIESEMRPKPQAENIEYQGSNKLAGKVAVISGGDSGIGRAIAIAYAKEGADILIAYLNEHEDATETIALVNKQGRNCVSIAGNIAEQDFCRKVIDKALSNFNKIDILVNNAGVQFPQDSLEKITSEQLEHTFGVNLYSFFYLTQAALPHLQEGSCIINSTSVTAYKGSAHLIDYSASKGAIVTFTRSLSQALIDRGIRVNAVAPGPIWTPLIPASFSAEEVARFGAEVPMKRVGQPSEVAASYVFLASNDSSYMTGQVLHPNGGVIVNG